MYLKKLKRDEWLLIMPATTFSVHVEWCPAIKGILKRRGIEDLWRDHATRWDFPAAHRDSSNAAVYELGFDCASDKLPEWIAEDLDCFVERRSDDEWKFDLETSSPDLVTKYVKLTDDDAFLLKEIRNESFSVPARTRRAFGALSLIEALDTAVKEIEEDHRSSVASG